MFERHVKYWSLLLLFVFPLTTGCVSVASYHTARPIQPKKTEITVAMEAFGAFEADGIVIGAPRLNVRRGVSETFDYGLTAGPFGFGLDTNFLLVDGDSIAISFDPYLGVNGLLMFDTPDTQEGGYDSGVQFTSYAGILVDLLSYESFALTVGLKPGVLTNMARGDADTEHHLFMAGSVGAKIHIDGVNFLPEFGVIKVMDDEVEDMVWTFGLGLAF